MGWSLRTRNINGNFSDAGLRALRLGFLAQAVWGSSAAATQTIPNLLAEMNATRSVPKDGRLKTPAIPEYWRMARSSLSALRAAPWLESVLVGRNFPVPEPREHAG